MKLENISVCEICNKNDSEIKISLEIKEEYINIKTKCTMETPMIFNVDTICVCWDCYKKFCKRNKAKLIRWRSK